MTKEEAINELKKWQRGSDIEREPLEADDVLCLFLTELGHADLVAEFDKVAKWYA